MVFHSEKEFLKWLESCKLEESIIVSKTSCKYVIKGINTLLKDRKHLYIKSEVESIQLKVSDKNIYIKCQIDRK